MLEEILEKLGSKHSLRKNPICIADDKKYGDGYTKYECLTKSGQKAYDKLLDILLDLRNMGVLSSGNYENMIDELDYIVDNPNLQ